MELTRGVLYVYKSRVLFSACAQPQILMPYVICLYINTISIVRVNNFNLLVSSTRSSFEPCLLYLVLSIVKNVLHGYAALINVITSLLSVS